MDDKIRWFITVIILSLAPIFIRLLVYVVTKDRDGIDWFVVDDFIMTGIALSLSFYYNPGQFPSATRKRFCGVCQVFLVVLSILFGLEVAKHVFDIHRLNFVVISANILLVIGGLKALHSKASNKK